VPSAFRATAVIVTALLLAACAEVPNSGPVRQGQVQPLVPEEAGVPFIAEPPPRGASPEEIVTGFLRANADFSGDHEIARLYLAPNTSQRWRPGAGTVVYEVLPELRVEPVAADTVVVTGSQVATIDAEGSYRRAPVDTELGRSFDLREVDGEWRIAGLADGLLIRVADVDEVFRHVSLYFLAPSGATLVPDPVLLPQLPGLATKVMNRLLRGPTSDLRGAVRTAFPQGTELDVQSVPVENGTAIVRLNEAARRADDDARQQLSAQIVWTLKQLAADIESVRITFPNDEPITTGVNPDQPRDAWATFDPDGLPGPVRPYAVREGLVGRLLGDEEFEPVAGAAGDGSLSVRTPGISLDASRLAAVTSEGSSLVVVTLEEGAQAQTVATGADLSKPSWDPLGNLWWVDRATGGLFVLPSGATQPAPVVLPEIPAGPLQKVAVSRDGARIALVAGTGADATTLVGAITGADQLDGDRTPEGAVAVTGAHVVLPRLTSVTDVAWADAKTLLTIGEFDGVPSPPMYVSTDGYEVLQIGSQEQLVSLAAAPPLQPQENPVVGATPRGRLWTYVIGTGWQRLGPGSDPAYPG
jgi:hypothetical protein